ncbi:hypothetical protein [Ralstonia solanacearum]|uniref:hypothetical protein n=1 Tax=Ralstonia solanacearum TaxID=305 RepID=UPI003D2C45DE
MLAQLVGISLSVQPGRACYIPVAHRGPDVSGLDAAAQLSREAVLARMRLWLEDETRSKVGQHLKYDAHVFANHGIALRGITHDTMLQSYVLASHRNHGMDALAERVLHLKTITYEEVCGQGRGADRVSMKWRSTAPPNTPPRMPISRCACTARCIPRWPRTTSCATSTSGSRCRPPSCCRKMERNGVLVDAERLARQSAELGPAPAGARAGGPTLWPASRST